MSEILPRLVRVRGSGVHLYWVFPFGAHRIEACRLPVRVPFRLHLRMQSRTTQSMLVTVCVASPSLSAKNYVMLLVKQRLPDRETHTTSPKIRLRIAVLIAGTSGWDLHAAHWDYPDSFTP